MRDHRELLACCERRDAARAEELLRLHLDRTELAVRAGLRARRRTHRRRRLGSCAPHSSPSTRSAPVLGERPEPQAADGQAVVELLAASAQPGRPRHRVGLVPVRQPTAAVRPRDRRASAASSSPRASRPGRASGLPVVGSASRATAPSPRGSPAADEVARRGSGRGCDDVVAAALGVRSGLAAWMSLSWLAPVEPARRVLVLGATGSVGSVAVQVGEAARRGSRRRGRARPRPSRAGAALGADATVELDGDELPGAARRERSTATPPTLVLDRSADRRSRRPRRSPAPGGRIVHVGQSAAPTATFVSGHVRGKQLQILGYSNFAVPLDALARGTRT